VRGFRLDRIERLTATGETAIPRRAELNAELARIAARPLTEE
jgi:predicted DNA-binding transcriptional regulator YafY